MLLIKARRVCSRYISLFVTVCIVLTLSACATSGWDDEEIVLEQSGTQKLKQIALMQDRLDKVGGQLLINNVALCEKQHRNILGISVANRYSYSKELSELAAQSLGLGESLQVVNVIAGSGAQTAGLQSGDILLSINDKTLPQGVTAEQEVAQLLAPLMASGDPVRITVSRGGQQQTFLVPVTPACGFRVELGLTGHTNAYSDGQRILVTQGMLVMAQTDDELAYVIAKEMAHSALGHPAGLNNTHEMASLIDNLLLTKRRHYDASGIRQMPKEYDLMADALSLAMVQRAAGNIDGAPYFWKRIAERFPATSRRNYTYQHPNTNARLEALPKAVKRAKLAEERRLQLVDLQ